MICQAFFRMNSRRFVNRWLDAPAYNELDGALDSEFECVDNLGCMTFFGPFWGRFFTDQSVQPRPASRISDSLSTTPARSTSALSSSKFLLRAQNCATRETDTMREEKLVGSRNFAILPSGHFIIEYNAFDGDHSPSTH